MYYVLQSWLLQITECFLHIYIYIYICTINEGVNLKSKLFHTFNCIVLLGTEGLCR